jgi:hypothetical protein
MSCCVANWCGLPLPVMKCHHNAGHVQMHAQHEQHNGQQESEANRDDRVPNKHLSISKEGQSYKANRFSRNKQIDKSMTVKKSPFLLSKYM